MYQNGPNLTVLYALPEDGEFTGTPTPLLTLNKSQTTTFKGIPSANGVTITFNQLLNTPVLAKVLKDYAKSVGSTSSSTPEEVFLQDGTKEGGAGSTGAIPELFYVTYCGIASSRRQMFYGPCELTENVGDMTLEYQKFARRSFELRSVKTTMEITTIAAVYDATMIDPTVTTGDMPLTLVIPVDSHGFEAWAALPA